ncbi:MAG: DUF3304 domain-containing protein [Lysobacter sp.]|nr:DUF3304 domain-containing protein [Lysobacter sp.]
MSLWKNPLMILLFAGTMALAACEDPMTIASITGYNHNTEASGLYVQGFSVDDAAGSNAEPEAGAGATCCVQIPKRWHPGLQAKVKWSYSRLANDKRPIPPPREATVDIPDYNARGPGSLQVHFYPGEKLKIVISSLGIEHPYYPMSETDKRPWQTSKERLEYLRANLEQKD